MTKQKEDWEWKFDNLDIDSGEDMPIFGKVSMLKIKSFIRSLLSQQREEIIEKIRGIATGNDCASCDLEERIVDALTKEEGKV